MRRETAGENALELAARRLDRAVELLEERLAVARPTAAGGDLFSGRPATDVAAELERARARERELEAAGAEASAALGRAIQEIQAALNGAAQG
jgi:hypothetical protein